MFISQALRNWPHYAILVDERDPITTATMAPEATYVVQQELELMPNTEVSFRTIVYTLSFMLITY